MRRALLVVNAGSTSAKVSAFAVDGAIGAPSLSLALTVVIDLVPEGLHLRAHAHGRSVSDIRLRLTADAVDMVEQAVNAMLTLAGHFLPDAQWIAAGHRIVHGGERYRTAVHINDEVLSHLQALSGLAPLHQPANLHGVHAVSAMRRGLPQIACFDTAFHGHLLPAETWLGLPRVWREAGMRRYGFHGLAYESVVAQLPPAARDERVLLAHLGGGASLCALRSGRSIATSMGFTALDGLLMGTRCGSLDPGAVLHLLRAPGMTIDRVDTMLHKECGLLGISGASADMRVLLQSDEPAAVEAIEVFCHRVVREAGALIGLMEGLDRVVFSGGIGERAARVRARICDGLGWLGVRLDSAANAADARRISSADSAVVVEVVPADEQRVIAEHVVRLIASVSSAAA